MIFLACSVAVNGSSLLTRENEWQSSGTIRLTGQNVCVSNRKRANASYCIESHLSAAMDERLECVVEWGVTSALVRAQYPLIRLTVCVVMPLFQCFLCIEISVYPLVRFDNPVRERSPHELIQLTKGFREPVWKREPGLSLCSVSTVRHRP